MSGISMKSGLILAILLLGAACGEPQEPAAAEDVGSDEVTIVTDEGILQDRTMEEAVDPSSPGLTACTLSVTSEGSEWEISLLWTGPPETVEAFHSIHTLSLRPLEGGEATVFRNLDASIPDVMDASGYLVTEDMNFDGFMDFRLMENPTAGPNTYWLFWLYDPETGTFTKADVWNELGLVSPEFLPEEHRIRSFSRDGYGLYETRMFDVTEGIPMLAMRIYTEWEDDTLYSITEELVDGAMMETSREILEEEV